MVKLFVEGGGDKPSRADFREGLCSLVEKVISEMPDVVACGPRGNALNKFRAELNRGGAALLLVDSESPVRPQNFGRPWAHLAESDNWQKPDGAKDGDAHLMAQCMESWFVADPGTLESHFGQGFKSAKLPQNSEVEEVAKDDVMSGLKAAAKGTRSGEYQKARDGFALIGKIVPSRVAKRARHAERFFGVLRRKCGARKESE